MDMLRRLISCRIIIIIIIIITKSTQTIKFIWLIILILSIRRNSNSVLHAPEFCYFVICFHKVLEGSVATCCRCGGKYDMILVENLPLSLTVKKFRKSVNICQSYEGVLSGTFFIGHGVYFNG